MEEAATIQVIIKNKDLLEEGALSFAFCLSVTVTVICHLEEGAPSSKNLYPQLPFA